VKYLCGGAVSGPWWMGQGAYRAQLDAAAKPGAVRRPDRAVEGYNLVDLHSDGRVEREYVTYGWNAAAE
jgi:hypothetical protein